MSDWPVFLAELRAQSAVQSHQHLKQMSKIVNEAKNRRYGTDRRPKNAMVEHGFLPEEFRRFMEAVEDPRDRLAFVLVALLGLRPNEAVRLKGRNVQGGKLLIPASKGGYEADLRLPEPILRLLPAVESNEPLLGMTQAALGRKFRRYRKKAELTEIYGYGLPGGRTGKQERPLHKFSLKSMRYMAAQRVLQDTGNLMLASRLLRHRKITTTAGYMQRSMRAELESALDRISGDLTPEMIEAPIAVPAVRG